jgi:streptogramin lyase
MWQRTASRLGRTDTIGPQTPTFAWKVRVDFFPESISLEASPVMDVQGRVFVMHVDGLTAVDSIAREVMWTFPGFYGWDGGIALWKGYVMYGTDESGGFGGRTLYCLDAETGAEKWRESTRGLGVHAPMVDDQGIVYFVDSSGVVYARWIEDGSEVWTADLADTVFASPSLDGAGELFSGRDLESVGASSDTGGLLWNFPTGAEVRGVLAVEDGRVYVGSRDRNLYCVSALTGEEIWRFPSLNSHRGGAAIGHDGTVYTGVVYRVFALDRDGEELWRYEIGEEWIPNTPIVGGDGTIYFCTQTSPNFGTVRALRPDGNELWTYTMPHQVSASPMLAPDGTLYVLCVDKNLYAFRDPVGDLDFDGDIDLDDFAKFGECFTGPRLWGEGAKTTPGCELLDFDSDWDVDFTDLGQFQLAFSGPK